MCTTHNLSNSAFGGSKPAILQIMNAHAQTHTDYKTSEYAVNVMICARKWPQCYSTTANICAYAHAFIAHECKYSLNQDILNQYISYYC